MKASTRKLIALIIGGFAGAELRFGIGEWMSYPADGFPWSTLLINLSGCLFLGWFLTITLTKFQIRPETRLGLGTGMTGAFTTFSAFSVQSVHLFTSGHSGLAFIYIGLSAFGGAGLSIIGAALAASRVKADLKGELSK